jgi:hypothetical protein
MMQDKNIMLNTTLADLRGRVDTLAKSVFLIGGGAVTLSINLYLGKPKSFAHVIFYLKISWVLLFLAMVLFSLVIGLLIAQSYISTEFYRKKLERREEIKEHPKRFLDFIALIFGIFGLMLFLFGMITLMLAATYL